MKKAINRMGASVKGGHVLVKDGKADRKRMAATTISEKHLVEEAREELTSFGSTFAANRAPLIWSLIAAAAFATFTATPAAS